MFYQMSMSNVQGAQQHLVLRGSSHIAPTGAYSATPTVSFVSHKNPVKRVQLSPHFIDEKTESQVAPSSRKTETQTARPPGACARPEGGAPAPRCSLC